MAHELQIQPTPPQRQYAALELLFDGLAQDERAAQMATTLAALRRRQLATDGLLEAIRGERLVGVVWASRCGPGAAMVWPPQLVEGEEESTATAMLHKADEWMRTTNVQFANAYLTDDQSNDARRLTTAGYKRLAEILYLVSQPAAFPDHPPAQPQGLSVVPYDEHAVSRLIALLEKTYEGTLDCPLLNGQQATADVLAGYRGTGEFRPEMWMFVRDGDSDVGCLLLADHPADQQYELVYQGVMPATRGRGLGLFITRYAQWLTAQAGRERLVLAVDAANHPALRIYREAGFRQWDRRFLLLKTLPSVE